MGWYFAFFFTSGFCSILYELVWLRLTMARFGVTTAQVSIVLSVFMAGLGLGSWASGVLVRRYGERISFHALRLYALAELLIGLSALAVPLELRWGHRLVESMVGAAPLSSSAYCLISGTAVGLIVIPWCACMGATIPLAMFAIRRDSRYATLRSFSFLYISNVVGAVAGAIGPLFLIELYGFGGALRVGALLNTAIASSAFLLTLVRRERGTAAGPETREAQINTAPQAQGVLLLLFLTGLATMGMEVVWVRLFTPYVGTIVYSFALILVSYLAATFVGSAIYRDSGGNRDPNRQLTWITLPLMGLLPLLTSDPRLPLNGVVRVILGVAPFAGMIGFLTPMLVDRWSSGDPDRAGRAYALNVLGCILGPLVSGFVLLPLVGERVSMLLFVLPWFAIAGVRIKRPRFPAASHVSDYVTVAATLAVFLLTRDYETSFPQREVLRDSTATVIATGAGMERRLITNGTGMTALTPITKMMAHLTLASLDQPPRNVLVICFGMGTTHRSVISWGVPSTAVELVPSVPRLFSYYHEDGAKVLASPLSQVVIDDGRRYLERSTQNYDAIIIDPPPPVQAAGSSLLYSEEFYATAKGHLRTGGILQQWLPAGDDALQASVARALNNSFPYVRVYTSIEGWGWHFLASMQPIPTRKASELSARMPAAAVLDLMEWGPERTPNEQLDRVLSTETTVGQLISLSPKIPPLQDDRPVNEYFLLRALFAQKYQ